MEEKKFNNALEKADNLSEDTKRVQGDNSVFDNEREPLSLEKKIEQERANARIRVAEERMRLKKQRFENRGREDKKSG